MTARTDWGRREGWARGLGWQPWPQYTAQRRVDSAMRARARRTARRQRRGGAK